MRVGIVGAGITGLALTHHVAKRGIECVTLEAADEPGGVIDSERTDGVVTERGPQRMRRTPAIDELIAGCDLEGSIIEAPDLPLYVYADGSLGEVPFTPRGFRRTDLLSWQGKLRLLAEPLTRRGRADESVAAIFRRKFGDEAYRNLFGPLYGGIYGSDPAAMPARHALSRLLDRERELHSLLRALARQMGQGRQFPPLSFEGGLQTLPRALADRYADRVRLGTPATGLAKTRDGWAIDTPDGDEIVDRVVVTAPASDTAALLEDLATGVEGLRSLTYNPLALVFLQSELTKPGMGYQIGYGEDLHTLGVTWNASLFGRDGLYTAFLGGMHEPDLVKTSAERLGGIASREFERVTGASATVLDVHRLERGFPAWDDSWDGLDALSTPEGIELATNYTARMGVPSRVREARAIAARLDGADSTETAVA